MLTPAAALGRALLAGRLRRVSAAAGSALASRLSLPASCPTLHDGIATAGALGAALVDGFGASAVVDLPAGPAFAVLTSLGLLNELRGPAVLVADTRLDCRAAWSYEAHLCQLEASVADEAYHLGRLAVRLSRHGGFPVVVRLPTHDRATPVTELPPDLPPSPGSFSRAAGPHRAGAESRFYHRQKRARRTRLVEDLMDLLCVQLGVEGPRAVIIAGHLPPDVQARAWARRLPSLRLGGAWPLPEARLRDFLHSRDRVLVLEEGEPMLVRSLRAFAHQQRMSCEVEGTDGPWPQILLPDQVETILTRFGGRVRGEVAALNRPGSTFTAIREAIDALPEDEDEPWPLYYARASSMAERAPADPPPTLVAALRAIGQPTVVVSEPTCGLEPRDAGRTLDIEVETGQATAVAGALADALGGALLPIAIVGQLGFDQLEHIAVFDNALARRDVLHIIVAPRTAASSIEARLRAIGLSVAISSLADARLGATLTAVAGAGQSADQRGPKLGPRALICHGER